LGFPDEHFVLRFYLVISLTALKQGNTDLLAAFAEAILLGSEALKSKDRQSLI